MQQNLSLEAAAAELLALAVTNIFPLAQLLTSGSDGFGFYYDFYIEQPLDVGVIPLIEEHIRGSIKSQVEMVPGEMMRENAAALFEHRGQQAKAELALQSLSNVISVVTIGEFCDLPFAACPKTLPSTACVKVLALLPRPFYLEGYGEIASRRIYAVVAADKKLLKQAVKLYESSEKFSHVLIGREMELFKVDESLGSLGVEWLPKGAHLCDILQQIWRQELFQRGFQLTRSKPFSAIPVRGKKLALPPDVLPTFELEGARYALCASVLQHHMALFACKERREDELPLCVAEWVERFRGTPLQQLTGLFVSRSSSMDVAHIFCSQEGVVAELISSLQFIQKIITIVGVECQWIWAAARTQSTSFDEADGKSKKDPFVAMEAALQACGIVCLSEAAAIDPGTDDPEIEASFQPQAKVEVRFRDAMGRSWPGPSLSVDFHLPTQRGLCYQRKDGSRHPCVLIEASFCGLIERLIAILLEQNNGWLPLKLAPEQFRVLAVGEENQDYAKEVLCKLRTAGMRAGFGSCSSYIEGKAGRGKVVSLGAKIHAAESERVPYLLILGSQEKKDKTLSIRALAQESKEDSKSKVKINGQVLSTSSSKAVPKIACSWESFLERFAEEVSSHSKETCNLGVSNHVES